MEEDDLSEAPIQKKAEFVTPLVIMNSSVESEEPTHLVDELKKKEHKKGKDRKKKSKSKKRKKSLGSASGAREALNLRFDFKNKQKKGAFSKFDFDAPKMTQSLKIPRKNSLKRREKPSLSIGERIKDQGAFYFDGNSSTPSSLDSFDNSKIFSDSTSDSGGSVTSAGGSLSRLELALSDTEERFDDEELSQVMEIVRGEFDFEIYEMELQKFQEYPQLFKLPKDFVVLECEKKRIETHTPGRFPRLNKSRIVDTRGDVRESLTSFSRDWMIIKRKYTQTKRKVSLSFEMDTERIYLHVDVLKKLKQKSMFSLECFKGDNHVLALGHKDFHTKTIKPFQPSLKFLSEKKILVAPRCLGFFAGRFEPLFCKLTVYNIRTKRKITEDFHFHLNPKDVVNLLNLKGDFKKELEKYVKTNPKTLFSIPKQLDEDLYLVLIVNTIYTSDVKPYIYPKKFRNFGQLITKGKNISKCYPYLQPFVFGYLPLYEKKEKEKKFFKVRSFSMKSKKSHNRHQSLSARDSQIIMQMEGVFNENDPSALENELVKSVIDQNSLRFGNQSPSSPNPDEDEEGELPIGVTVLRKNILKFELFLFPSHCGDVIEIITKEKKNLKIQGFFEVEISEAGIDKMYENDNYDISQFRFYENMLESCFLNSLSLYPQIPLRYFVNFCYVYPKELNFSGILGLGIKKQNITLKMIVRNEDTFPQEGKLSSLKVICKKYIADMKKVYKHSYYTEVIPVGDKKSTRNEFNDEIKLLLPFELTDVHHIVFIVYALDDKRPKQGEKVNKTVVGYAFCGLKKHLFDNDDKTFVINVYKELKNGYLTNQKNLKKLKRRKIVTKLKFVSSIIPSVPIIYAFMNKIGEFLDLFTSWNANEGVLEHKVANKEELINKRVPEIENIFKEILNYQDVRLIVPYFNTILNLALSLMVSMYDNKDYSDENKKSISLLIQYTFSFINEMLKRFPNLVQNFAFYFLNYFGNIKNSFSLTICTIWFKILTKKSEKKRRHILQLKSKNKKKEEEKKLYKGMLLDHCRFWFHLILKGIYHQKKLCMQENFKSTLENLVIHLVNLIFDKKKQNEKDFKEEEPEFSDEILTKVNNGLAFFIIDLFSIYPNDLFPKRMIHYYHFTSLHNRKLSKIKKNLKMKLNFLVALTSNKFFVEFNDPQEGKYHCLVDVVIDSILQVLCHPLRPFSNDFLKKHLELLNRHLIELDYCPTKQGKRKREVLASMYFSFFEKLVHMAHLYDVDTIGLDDSKNKNLPLNLFTIEIIDHLKLPEKEKICSIVLFILSNLSKEYLLGWFENTGGSIPGYFVKFLRYILIIFSRDLEEPKKEYDFYCIKVIDIFNFVVENLLHKLILNPEYDEVITECFEFSFTLFHLEKCSVNVFMYYLTKATRYFIERISPKLCFLTNDERWRKCLYYLLDKSVFPFQFNTFNVIYDCIDILIGRYVEEIKNIQKKKPFEKYFDEKEIIGKNIILNEKNPPFKEGSVKGASLSKLVEYLAFQPEGRKVSREVIFITHKSFLSTLDLLNVFFSMYKSFKDDIKKQNMVVDVLVLWLKKYFYTFENIDIVFIIRNITIFNKDQLKKIKVNLMNALYNKKVEEDVVDENDKLKKKKIVKYKSIIPSKFKNSEKVIKKVIQFRTWQEYSDFILTWDPKEIARQMCLLEFHIFQRISPGEFFKKKKEESYTNIDVLTRRFNGVCSWLQNNFIRYKQPKKRKEVAKKFISILKNLRNLHNYNAVNEFIGMFFSSSMERLIDPEQVPKGWSKISSKDYKVVTEAYSLMSHNRAFKKLREELEKNNFAIPFLGLFTKDITQIEHGNSDYWDISYNKKNFKLINLNKRTMISDSLAPVRKFQKKDYQNKIRKVPVLYDAIKEIAQRADFLSNSRIYDLSWEYKPKR